MPRSLKVLIIVGALVVALVPVAAVAGHQFTDVPNSHTFHADISWLADKGITKGCNPPANTMYCPDGAVTRGQMAAFMHRFETRLGTRYAGAAETNVLVPNDTNTRLATTNMTVPSSGGALTVKGMASLIEGTSDQVGLIWAEVNNGGRCDLSAATFAGIWDTLGAGVSSANTTGGGRVSAGQYRIDLCALGFGPTSSAAAEIEVIWIATGATGGNVAQLQGSELFDITDSKFDIDELKSRLVGRTSD
jgi:hypothetical protein